MSMQTNKTLLQDIYAALSRGDSKPFVAALADDFTWIVRGDSSWAGEWRGKERVRNELFAPLFDQFADRYTNTPKRFIADGDLVVVECQGKVTTKTGARSDNFYCIIYRVEHGQLKQAVEYMDTALADRVLAPPKAHASSSTSQYR